MEGLKSTGVEGTPPPCPCCRTVETVCFWAPRAPAAWKRPALLAVCTMVMLALGALLWVRPPTQIGYWLTALCAALVAVGALGLFVGVRGCDACVARSLG
jgi:hypothetical protein